MSQKVKESKKDFNPTVKRNTSHGDSYQLKLNMIAAIRANGKNLKFVLISEAKEFGHFDDLVIDYGDRITYLQAKHSIDGIYSYNDFCKDGGDASLAKYFDSWYYLKDSKYSKKDDGTPKETKFIFFTNKEVKKAESDFLQKINIEDDDEFNFLSGDTCRIKLEGQYIDNFIDAILAFSKKLEKISKSTNFDINTINFTDYRDQIKVIINYLKTKKEEEKKEEEKKEEKSNVPIDGRSHLTIKERSLIKLAIENSSIADILFEKEPDLRNWFTKYITKIDLKITNFKNVLSPTEIMKKHINNFLIEFLIKLKQPNDQELYNIILTELRQVISIGTEEFYGKLYLYMSDWLSDKSKCCLPSEKFSEYFEELKADSQRFKFLHYTESFLKECEDHIIKANVVENIEDLEDFLTETNNNNNHIALISDKGGGIKLQIYNTVLNMQNELKNDEWSFLKKENMECLKEILACKSSKFFILDFRLQIINENDLNILSEICQITINNEKKLILLTKDNTKLIKDLRLLGVSALKEMESLPLKDEQIAAICESYQDKYLTLCQKDYQIADIIIDKNCGVYELMRDVKYLQEILENLKVNEDIVESEMPYGVYIPNEIIKFYHLSILSQKIAKCYFIIADNINGLESMIKDFLEGQTSEFNITIIAANNYSLNNIDYAKTNIFIILNKEFIKLQDQLKNSNFSFITLKTNDNDHFEILETQCNLNHPENKGILFSDKKEKRDNYIDEIIRDGNLSLLISPAGYGKTSFCKNIVEKFKTLQNWIITMKLSDIKISDLKFDENGDSILNPFLKMQKTWEIEAYEKDKQKKGRVLIILDGFDEVKDQSKKKLIIEWINRIPKEISVLITTRDYAANELSRLTDRIRVFYKLAEYTEEQRDEYLKEYIEKFLEENNSFNQSNDILEENNSFNQSNDILEENNSFNQSNDILKEIKNKMSAVNLSRVLGIPLESYIFCESLKPQIIRSNLTEIKKIDVGNLVKLYQQFIISKSRLYFEKMKCIISDDDSQLLIFMGTSNQIIELYALWQAFSLQKDIKDYTQDINFDLKNLISLNHMGILRVIDGRLVFNHETYQEFYASLAIIRGILNNTGKLFELVKNLVQNNRYDPKYSMIFSFASQFSFLSEPAMVPGYKFDKHFMSFWNLLGEDGDVYGYAALSFFKNCISELTDKEKKILLIEVEKKEWSKLIIRSKYLADKLTFHEEEGLSFSFQSDEKITDQNRIDFKFKELRKDGNLTDELVKNLEQETHRHNNKDDAGWAVIQGINAIAYTGKFFSLELANYLIKRSKFYDNNERFAILALISIFKDIDTVSDQNAKNNCFYTISRIFLKKPSVKEDNMPYFKRLLNLIDYHFLEYLKDELIKSLSDFNKIYLLYSQTNDNSLLEFPFQLLRLILFTVKNLKYAVLVDEQSMKISLVKSEKIDFMFNCENSKKFANLIFMLLKLNYNSNVIDLDFQGFSRNKLKDDDDEKKFKKIMNFNYVVICLANSNDLFDVEFGLKENESKDLLDLYTILFECKLITKHHVDKFKEKLTDKNAKELQKHSYWSLNGGIEIAGYTGIYFDSTIAEFLLERSYSWPDNAKKAIESFTRIYKSLSSFKNLKHADYIEAVNTYNAKFNDFSKICSNNGLKCVFYQIPSQEIPTTTKRSLSSDDNNIDNDKRLRSDTIENTI